MMLPATLAALRIAWFRELPAAMLHRMQGYSVVSATATFCLLASMGPLGPRAILLLGALFAVAAWLFVWSQSKLQEERVERS
jgi:hypothetical protein